MNALQIEQIELHRDPNIAGLRESLPMLCRMVYGWEIATVSDWGDGLKFRQGGGDQFELDPKKVLDWAYCERLLPFPWHGDDK